MTKKMILLCITVALGVVLWRGARGATSQLEISNAYVTGHILNIASPSEGIIDRVNVKKGDRVTKGQVLFSLETERDKLAIDQRVEVLRTALRLSVQSCFDLKIAAGSLRQTQVSARFLRDKTSRTVQMAKSNVASLDDVRLLESRLREQEVAADIGRFKLAELQYVNRLTLVQRPEVKAAMSALKAAYYDRFRHEVKAPSDGYIYDVLDYPGLYARAGDPQVIFVPDEQTMVEANVLESELKLIKPHARVYVVMDVTEKTEPLTGYVHSVVPAATAGFSKLPRNNADSNWIKVSQRVPVLIALTETNSAGRYPIGTSARVIIPREHAEIEPSQVGAAAARDTDNREPPWDVDYRKALDKILENDNDALSTIAAHCHAH